MQGELEIVSNSKIANSRGIFSLVIESTSKTDVTGSCLYEFLPGQYLTIQCGENTICPRPFSIARSTMGKTEVLYQVRGEGTKWLSERKPKEKVFVVGPQGTGFVFNDVERPLLIAGGMGIASMLGILGMEDLGQRHFRLVYGTKSIYERIPETRIPNWKSVDLITEEGCTDRKGRVTDFMPEFIDRYRPDVIYACGPMPMLKALQEKLAPYGDVPCQVSLEAFMGCGGLGNCNGCVIKTVEGRLFKVCQDGPVIDLNRVCFDE